MNVITNKLYNSQSHSNSNIYRPDEFSGELDTTPPSDNFVLCKDSKGNPTAIYGNDIWNFTPYAPLGSSASNLDFKSICGVNEEHSLQLRKEVKWLMFCLIYKSGSGRLGRLSTSTLYEYFRVIHNITDLASKLSNNPFNNRLIYIRDVLENKANIQALAHSKDRSKKSLNSLISKLVDLGKDKIGYTVCCVKLSRNKNKEKQHPVIPVSLYLHLVNALTDEMERLHSGTSKITAFLVRFSEKGYGLTHSSQKKTKVKCQPTMQEAIRAYDLNSIFPNVTTVHELLSSIKQIQFTLKTAIHLYTGMRHQEVMRLPLNCISTIDIHKEEKDNSGKVVVPARMIKLISTTTKYTGYRKEDAWYAPDIIVKAIEVLQRIAKGLCFGSEIACTSETPLFLSAGILIAPVNEINNEGKHALFGKIKNLGLPQWFLDAVITEKDMELLKASDPSRDFENERDGNGELKFKIGGVWPLTSHQLRRSLAFYACSSGFVSIPTLKRQYKHLTAEITKYYSRNHQNIVSIFGHYDAQTGKWMLPETHVIFDCQAAFTMDVAEQFINDLLEDEPLFGKSGSYMSRQAERIFDGEVSIVEFRATTEEKIKNGEIVYNKTLLGGCTNINGCDCRILGEFTDCLSSDCAVIKRDKVEKQILEIQKAMQFYAPKDGEYQVLEAELDSLNKFKKYQMNKD
ncbi:TPA: hypothetical protein ACSP0J_000646 [Aeromonas veronii]|uniref:hypothetical protein n=1 Tax=Aeromonas TaxID=642 RepID=UPI000F8F1CDF|nr:hypothetical protein [Aeromonas veronii]RUR51009.1 hypothetical protein ELS78_22165 [Aeromonas veronii]HDO1314262.1 hypothetical protein [Aeromonas veronii]